MNENQNNGSNQGQGTSTQGTELKRKDIFSSMAYLGKSEASKNSESAKTENDNAKTEQNVQAKRNNQERRKPESNADETSNPSKDRNRNRRNSGNRSGQENKETNQDRTPRNDQNRDRNEPNRNARQNNNNNRKPRLTGKADAEERAKLRKEQIEKVNDYLPEEKSPTVVAAHRARMANANKTESSENTIEIKPQKQKKGKKPIKILFLGGVGEIGKNMTAIEFGNDIIIIDAGLSFPDEEMPGVDLVVPDVSYLVENKDKIKAIFLTHGHEDHIGGLPYLLKQINSRTPVYGTRLTLALADNKIKEHRIPGVVMRTQKPGDKVKAGCFEVEFVNVNHSISGAVAFAINTPYGIIYHSGDFKIDLTPVAGEPIDLNRISEIGNKGVVLYLGESTNIERPGYTMSETIVGTTFEHLFAENISRRIVIATFASNVHRLQQIIDVAVRYRRKVALSGRSMLNVVDAATKIGELTIPEGVLVDVEKIKNYFDNEIVIISTGTQGEPMSALTRMANGEFNKVTIGNNDTIILSATPIPGNEKMIYRVINNLYKKGASVVYESLEKVHVSGHACQEEHKIIHQLLKPKFFIPVHGEYRHLRRHALLAEEMGMRESNIIIPEIGNCVELTDSTIKLGNNFAGGSTIIDGTGSEDFSTSEVMKDRRLISSEGMFIVAVSISDGVIVGDPEILNKGVMLSEERDYKKEMLTVVSGVLERFNLTQTDRKAISQAIEKGLKDYLFKKTRQSPLIVPVLMYI